jgi:cell division septal protein FtsQ
LKKNLTKILNAVCFLIISIALIFLSVKLKSNTDYKINSVLLEGNTHLSEEQLLQYVNITDKDSYNNLTLQVIKDRFEKHPYIQTADVRYDGNGQVSVKLHEKTFESVLIDSTGKYLLTEKLQMLPVLPQSKKIDYPVISNPFIPNGIKVLASFKKNYDLVTAAKIISTVKLLNQELYDNLSSVDLENGGDVILNFSNFDYSVIVGRGSEIRKIISFNNFWSYLKGKEINKHMEYVDLRYSGHIYLGIIDSANGSAKNIEYGQNKS